MVCRHTRELITLRYSECQKKLSIQKFSLIKNCVIFILNLFLIEKQVVKVKFIFIVRILSLVYGFFWRSLDIYGRSLQPFSQDYKSALHTTYVVSVNFTHLQFRVDFERQIFDELFMAILFTLRTFPINMLRVSRRTNIFLYNFVFVSDLGLKRGFMSNKPTHYLLDYGDYRPHTLEIVYKNSFDRIRYCEASCGSHMNEMMLHF